MSEREWHYVYQRTREGPIPESALRTRLENAELPMDVLVWCEALDDWVVANEEPSFQNIEVCPRRPAPAPAPAPQPQPQPQPVQRTQPAPAPTPRTAPRTAAPPPRPANPAPPLPRLYLHRNGINVGPYTQEAVVKMVATGAVLGTELIWREGTPAWVPVSVALGLSQIRQQPPLRRPSATVTPTSRTPSLDGVARAAYFGLILAILFVVVLIAGSGNNGGLACLFAIIAFPLLIAQRLKNIGYNPWLVLVPFVNAFFAIVGLLLPPGYARTKQLDAAAKFLIALAIGVILIMIARA